MIVITGMPCDCAVLPWMSLVARWYDCFGFIDRSCLGWTCAPEYTRGPRTIIIFSLNHQTPRNVFTLYQTHLHIVIVASLRYSR
jgi:hypothetical protein